MGVTGLSKKIRPGNGATNISFEELIKSDETKTILGVDANVIIKPHLKGSKFAIERLYCQPKVPLSSVPACLAAKIRPMIDVGFSVVLVYDGIDSPLKRSTCVQYDQDLVHYMCEVSLPLRNLLSRMAIGYSSYLLFPQSHQSIGG